MKIKITAEDGDVSYSLDLSPDEMYVFKKVLVAGWGANNFNTDGEERVCTEMIDTINTVTHI